MGDKIRVTVWNENVHERHEGGKPAQIYPNGMHSVIADYLKKQPGLEVRTATMEQPEHGLTNEVLDNTDVLIWWAHMAHGDVQDEIVNRVHERVLGGMGLIPLHSGHFSKIFQKLMGTTCNLLWREIGEKERLWVIDPAHPITQGLGAYFEIPHEEMYGERFDIPQPDELVLVSWFAGGEVFRSGCCWHRGRGKIFYFRPGHESYPTYYQEEVMKVITNGVRWAAPLDTPVPTFGNREPLEDVEPSE
jgi:trehalose utilization protein